MEISVPVNRKSLEWAHGRAIQEQKAQNQSFADRGMRAARARDPKLLYALERGAEILQQMSEEQTGRTRRDPSTPYGFRVEHTESSLWREAYKLADKGEPGIPFEWIYGAAALLCGFGD